MAEATVTEVPFSEFLRKQKEDREKEAAKKSKEDKAQAAQERERLREIKEQLSEANQTQKKSLQAEIEKIKEDRKSRREGQDIRSQEVKDIADSKAALEQMRERIEANGGVATANSEFIKESNKIQKDE